MSGLETVRHGYDDVPMFQGEPWRGACPNCGSRSIRQVATPRKGGKVWRCNSKGCQAWDFEPVDVKGDAGL